MIGGKAVGADMQTLPLISVVIPCRNERQYISQCLDSILASDYPANKLEVLVIDGMSDDGTREVLDDYNRRFPCIHRLDNPKGITPVAFNLGVKASHGSPILIMSAHAMYAPDAMRKLVTYAVQYGAANVGGIWKIIPREEGRFAKAIAAALSHPFGVGGARYRTVSKDAAPMWVDTAAYGCYRREVFDDIGLFNENLVHSQDIELNLRLKAAGGRTLLVPEVVIYYFARTGFTTLIRHNYRNGQWAILPFAYANNVPVSPRHLVPCCFVALLILSAMLSFIWQPFVMVLTAILLCYMLSNICASIHIAVREHDPVFLFMIPVVFATVHLTYGWGSVWGLCRLARMPHFWKRVIRVATEP